MRIFIAFLVFFAVIYLWDAGYNYGQLWDGLQSMGRQISHGFGH
jgi:hypothetical protein